MKKQSLVIIMMLLLFFQAKAQQNPLNLCYVEVNNNNLLNVGSYTLANSGKQTFDIAVIFAANINYDTSKNRAYIYNNNNVTKVLDNVNTYVRPLQAKGIKVLLSLIGNHQGAGILNFQTKADARDFALQISNTVYTYGLDGIDFDDEYANYPSVGNVKNTASFTMLLQELKSVMPDKLITFYDFSDSGVGSPLPVTYLISGSDYAGNYINYAYNGLYTSYIPMTGKVPPLGKTNLGSAAFNLQSSTTNYINTYSTRSKTDGYGVVIWYDLRDTDSSSKISTATNNLFSEATTFSGQSYSWTTGTACDPPLGLEATNLAGTSAILKWTTDATKTYNIDYKLASATTWTNAASNYSGSSISISNLTANTDYDWRIQSVCSSVLTSTYIFAPRFNTGNGCIPPYDLSAGNFKGISASVSWSSTNANSYTLQYKAAADTNWTTIQNITANSYSLQGLTSNTVYSWKVQGICNSQTLSSYSSEATFKSGFTPVQSPGNRSLSFNGSTNYLDAGNINLSGDELTLEGWVKVNTFQSNFPYITSVAGIEAGDSNSALLRFGDADIPTGDYLQFVLSLGSSQVKLKSNTKFNTNTWYHIVATYNGTSMKIYVNGTLDANVAASGSFNANGTFYLGARNTTNNDRRLNGYLDEFRVWKKALSAEDISANKCYVSPNSSGLEASWKMNEGSGVAAFDQTVNTHFAVLTNMSNSNWNNDVACAVDMAVNDIASDKNFKIYPNPVKKGEDIHFLIKESSAKVLLYDLSGKLIKQQTIMKNNAVMNTNSLSSGTYIYKIQSDYDNSLSSGKIIVK